MSGQSLLALYVAFYIANIVFELGPDCSGREIARRSDSASEPSELSACFHRRGCGRISMALACVCESGGVKPCERFRCVSQAGGSGWEPNRHVMGDENFAMEGHKNFTGNRQVV